MELPDTLPDNVGLTTRCEIEISEAIQECVAAGLEHDDAKAFAETYAATLIQAGWTEGDIEAVLIGARRVLAKIAGIDAG